MRGRRTSLWIRTCLVCGTQQHAETKWDDPVIDRRPDAYVEHEALLPIRGRFDRLLDRQRAKQIADAIRATVNPQHESEEPLTRPALPASQTQEIA